MLLQMHVCLLVDGGVLVWVLVMLRKRNRNKYQALGFLERGLRLYDTMRHILMPSDIAKFVMFVFSKGVPKTVM